jgi:hypothetical protein
MDNVVDKLLLEWSWRCEKGYPDINNPADKKVLDKLLTEYGVSLDNIRDNVQEQEEDLIKHDTTKGELENLRKALEEIKEPYAKYLSVFYYFDPNSLGTISEVLLAKLLNTVQGIEAKHVGGAQGLADIVINGKTISLKTTSATKHIGLGQDSIKIDEKDAKEVVDLLFNEKETYSDIPVSELGKVVPPEIFKKIQDRLKAIASKVAGSSEDEYFVWVQKVYGKDNFLSSLTIHALNYDYNKVLEEFYNGYLYLTRKAWGIKDKNGTIIVQADTSGKLLNITPAFVEKSSKDKKIVIDLNVNNLKDKVTTQLVVSQEMFKALDVIYNVIANGEK